jgi:hypothetical protein
LGAALGVDPVWLRLAFVIFTLGSGAGIVLYLVAWIVIPEEGPGDALRAPAPVRPGRGSLIAGVVLVVVGASLLADALVPWADRVLWPLAVIAAGIGLVFIGSRR